jgi:hypothetical protein
MRSCLNKTGPFETLQINNAINGANRIRHGKAMRMREVSNDRFQYSTARFLVLGISGYLAGLAAVVGMEFTRSRSATRRSV